MRLESGTYLNELNEQQRAAVEYIDGPELVIAGAGSGKTRVLTYKIIHLLVKGYEPWRILALTFTNKAAREMRERVERNLGEATSNKLWMGTFHSVFAKLLRRHADRINYPSSFTIYDAQDSRNLIKSIIRELELDEKVYKPATVASKISDAKNRLIGPDEFARDAIGRKRSNYSSGETEIGIIYTKYIERLRSAAAMDFDDLLFYTHRLLSENDDIRAHYQEFFRYILVDEYQDTNHAQASILRLLTPNNEHAGICVVGDDAQSIYSFRGAMLANILGMEHQFPGLKLFKLERNYRSTENIINAAGSLISRNSNRIPKNVFSKNGPGVPVEIVQCFSDFEEAGLLASKISQLKAHNGDTYDEFAVLYRTNAQSRVLEESLRKRNIPYRIYGGLSFFQRKEVKDVVAYLRLALNPDDEEAIRRVINFPARKIGETTVKKVISAAGIANVSLFQVLCDPEKYKLDVNKPTAKRLVDFSQLISRINDFTQEHSASETVEFILSQTGLDTYYDSDTTPENISKRENLAELYNYASQYVESKAEQGLTDELGLAAFMTEISLATDADNTDNQTDDEQSVTLMTIHSAKGLEFKNVFVVGVEKNLLPSMLSCSSTQEIEEERRLLYVAMTRAKKYCMLSYASSRYMNGQTAITGPSPFLAEIDSKYIKLAPGTKIANQTASHTFQQSFRRPSPILQKVSNNDNPLATLHAPGELKVGMKIMHSRFNRGIITQILHPYPGGSRIVVRFDSEGTKTLMLQFAKFVILT